MLIIDVKLSTPENEIPKQAWFDKDDLFHFYLTVPEDPRWMDIYNDVEGRNFIENLRLAGDPQWWLRAIETCLRNKKYSVEFLKGAYENADIFNNPNLPDYFIFPDETPEDRKINKELHDLSEEFYHQFKKMANFPIISVPHTPPKWFRWGTERNDKYGY